VSWKTPYELWEGGEVWILGGGPSVPIQFNVPKDIIEKVTAQELPPSTYSPYMSQIHNKHVIGVNLAFLIGDWIDIIFFGDSKFFKRFRAEIASYKAIKVSCNSKAISASYHKDNIKYLPKDGSAPYGLTKNSKKLSWNQNSGCAAINLAANLGAKRIILLGFDMKLDKNNKQHWHSFYSTANRKEINPKSLPFQRHLRSMDAIARDARKRGIEIINANPDSAIEHFKKMSVKDLL
jgi:hypothetical protein